MKPVRVEKSWGHELWIHNDAQYCGKLLVFTQDRQGCSMHYHMKKNETWYVQEGSFIYRRIAVNSENGGLVESILEPGCVIEIPAGLPHQLILCASKGIIFEVSTQHFEDDSYRIFRNYSTELM